SETVWEGKSEKKPEKKLKFSYNEQREFDMLGGEIEKLEDQLTAIDEEMATITTDFVRLNELNTKKEEVEENLLEKMERFEYLSDLNDKILAQKKG
ncbi:ABC-F family ATP-binding cassette domain-containing protein, partial [Aduncisulcus paluster]